jgi:2-polyprenyl-3-methyl-5-hydroxy-6-metoxy-1,4-benzoquinol methylase
MSDIRPALYERYVSTFKQENEQLTSADLAHYYQWCDRRYFPFLKELPKSAAILELGCGHGRILNYLHQKGFANVRGIDISSEQIMLAKEHGLNAEREDVFEYLEETTEKFDCIIAIDFFEHFTKEELMRLVPMIKSSLRPNGLLLVQTVNGEGLFPRQIIYGDITHMTVLTPGSMSQLLRGAGFQRIEFAECAPIARGVIGFVRSALWKLTRFGANVLRMIEAGKRQAVWTENFITVARA